MGVESYSWKNFYIKRGTQAAVLVYLIASIVSFVYVNCSGQCNGDFSGVRCRLSFEILLFILIGECLPFLLVWLILNRRKNCESIRSIDMNFLYRITIVLLVIHILFKLIWGVGVMGEEKYNASGFTLLMIQILYRFDPIPWAYLYVLNTSRKKNEIVIILLLALRSITSHSLGGFFAIFLLVLVKYYNEIRTFLIRHKVLFIGGIIIVPYIISIGYSFRASLRTESAFQVEGDAGSYSIIYDRLAGRLSSFSNSAYFIEHAPFYKYRVNHLASYFYQKEGLNPAGIHFPGQIAIGSFFRESLGDKRETVSYMLGPVGIFVASYMISMKDFFLNVTTYVFLICALIFLASKLPGRYGKEIGVLLSMTPIVSGNASEFTSSIIALVLMLIIFKMKNLSRRNMLSC